MARRHSPPGSASGCYPAHEVSSLAVPALVLVSVAAHKKKRKEADLVTTADEAGTLPPWAVGQCTIKSSLLCLDTGGAGGHGFTKLEWWCSWLMGWLLHALGLFLPPLPRMGGGSRRCSEGVREGLALGMSSSRSLLISTSRPPAKKKEAPSAGLSGCMRVCAAAGLNLEPRRKKKKIKNRWMEGVGATS
jgi:hypothetical protein